MKRLHGTPLRRPTLTPGPRPAFHPDGAPQEAQDKTRMIEEMRDAIAREVGPFLGGLR